MPTIKSFLQIAGVNGDSKDPKQDTADCFSPPNRASWRHK